VFAERFNTVLGQLPIGYRWAGACNWISQLRPDDRRASMANRQPYGYEPAQVLRAGDVTGASAGGTVCLVQISVATES